MQNHQFFIKNLLVIAALFAVFIPIAMLLDTQLLPPVTVFFEAAQLPGSFALGLLGVLTRFGVTISMFVLSFVKLIAVSDHHSEALKRRARTISLMFMITGAWTSTVAMLIEFGGFWHIVSLMFGLVELGMAIYTVTVVLKTHEESIGSSHD